MTDLFWPGDHRARKIFSDFTYVTAMVAVENAWLSTLVDAGVAPADAGTDLAALVSTDDVEALATAAEADGNPVTALIDLLRDRAGHAAARWLHRGLTSQDVVDTAVMLCLRDALSRIRAELTEQVRTLMALAELHRHTPMLARTLTQPALPSTVGAKVTNWLSGVLDAADTVAALPALPVQAGGAVGILSAATELTGSPVRAVTLAGQLAEALDLVPASPWHTARALITRAADALVTCCDAWGHVASDVAVGSRAEIGELSEGRTGGSSTMPHKNNPVLSVLIRRTALTAPQLGATLHIASALSVDERSDGAWHAEWATLRTLARCTVVAAAQTSELLAGLQVNSDRAAANLRTAGDLLAEQRSMAELADRQAFSVYTGAVDQLIDAAIQRACHHMKDAT